MEQLALAAPLVTSLTLSEYRVAGLFLGWADKRISIHLIGTNGERREEIIEDTPSDPVATNLMKALNTMDLSVKSLHRRILEWLINNRGYVATVTGLPDA